MELALGVGLRAGVLLASAVTLAGGIWLLVTGQTRHLDLKVFNPDGGRQAFVQLLHHGPRTPETLIALGILLLIATPIFRVAAMVVGFLVERDYLYVAISAVVLSVLTLSLFL